MTASCISRVLFLLFSVSFALPGSASDAQQQEFCQKAQQIVAKTKLSAEIVIHQDLETFVDSKSTASPFVVHQYFSNPQPDAGGIPTVLSCKMKTAERINAAQSAGAEPVAQGNGSCQAVHQYWLEQLRASIPADQLSPLAGKVVADEEESTYMGPMWLRPWPFEPLYRSDDGMLHIRSKALYVPFAWWIPMPDRFKGTYYCHLTSPLYLEAILRGTTVPEV